MHERELIITIKTQRALLRLDLEEAPYSGFDADDIEGLMRDELAKARRNKHE